MEGLRQQINSMKQSLLDEGFLGDQFKELESLTDYPNPNFTESIIDAFFKRATQLINTIEAESNCGEHNIAAYKQMDVDLLELKGSSAGVGADKLKKEASQVIECLQLTDIDGAKAAFEKVKTEKESLKAKLDTYFELLKQLKSMENKNPNPSTK